METLTKSSSSSSSSSLRLRRSISPLLPISTDSAGVRKMKKNPVYPKSKSDQENSPPTHHPNVQIDPLASPSVSKKPLERAACVSRPGESPRSDGPKDRSLDHSDASVKVVVRIKPVNRHEREGTRIVQKVSSDTLSVGDRRYTFDSVLGSESTQEDIFKLVGVPLVKNSLAGFNTSILSYGQTGSGKTYTMWGPPSAMLDCHSINSYQGIAPRIFQMLFAEIQNEQYNSEGKQINYQCRCSFLEIYNEQINDLLDPTQRNLQIRDDGRNNFHVENLTDEYVSTVEEVNQILVKGLSNRKVGATSINSKSSRSHLIFSCTIESWCKGSLSKYFSSSKTSKISLVDLAGLDSSEPDGVGRHRIKEGKHVKKSLSKLGKLVSILTEAVLSGKDQKIPYTDCCLTHLLQEFLGGNAMVTFICTISQDDRHKAGILSTLRFGERAKHMQNKAVINEITEDDVNGLGDQIRQLKEELIKAKTHGDYSVGNTGAYFKGRNARESLNLLRVSLNRSLILPSIDNDSSEELDVDEDVMQLCAQLSDLHSSFEENSKDILENKNSICVSPSPPEENSKDIVENKNSICGSPREESSNAEIDNDTRLDVISFSDISRLEDCSEMPEPKFTSNGRTVHMERCVASQENLNSLRDDKLQESSATSSLSIIPCQQMPFLQDPTICLSPKVNNNLRRGILTSSVLSASKKNVSENTQSDLEKEPFRKCDLIRSSLPSSKVSPTESLAASLHRGLQIIDYHQRNSSVKRSLIGLSFEHLATMPLQSVDKVDAGSQTLPEDPFLCSACKKLVDVNGNGRVNENSEMQIIPIHDAVALEVLKKEHKDDNTTVANAIKKQFELETLCVQQATTIKQLNCEVDQYRHETGQISIVQQNQGTKILHHESLADGTVVIKELKNEECIPLSDEHMLLEHKHGNQGIQKEPAHGNTFGLSEREALLEEIQNLRIQLKAHTDVSVNDSLLEQIRNGSPSLDSRENELEKERQRWTESESKWISLTEELRLDLESNRRLAEKKEMELGMEKKCTAELDDALQRSILGHARIIEHYAELQEKHNELLERHRKVMEGISEVKKAAAKAGSKGTGKAFVAALAAELSTLRAERERERAYLKKQNRGLRIQLRDTAEAVHAAGELLVRLREAEEAVSVMEEKYGQAKQENEKLRKQIERMKKKHAMEMATMKHYLAESRLPESALEPLYHHQDSEIIVEETRVLAPDDEQAWRAAFRPSYQ